MRRTLLLLILLPLAIIVVVLSVANRASVTFSLDPFGGDPPALSLTAPFFVFLFATLALGVLLGGIAAWIRQGRWRGLARAERAELARTREEVERLRQRLAATAANLPLPPSRDAA
jgi:hypothetical protein